ncbi:hypothetical protein [Alteromonas sp. ALT199]|uniref:hypothetical protein n=1 Tax=unclassified Alteromonas TaxID=2614992 RepID=UPI002036FE64|nr:hypothetical protein [Alteromonas sp. ALT199]
MLEDLADAESESKELGELALAGSAAKEASAPALVTNCLRFISVIFDAPWLSVSSKVYLPWHYDENEATIDSYHLNQLAILKISAVTTPYSVH